MAQEQFTNFGPITLASPCLIGDLTITVTNPSALSLTGNYRLIIDNEIMLATSRSGAVVTVTRGVEGTAAAGHLLAADVEPGLTAGAINQLKADIEGAVSGTGFLHVTGGAWDGTAAAVDLTSEVTGTLPTGHGGTGLSAIGGANSVLTSTGAALAFVTTLAASVLPFISTTGDAVGSGTGGSIATIVEGLQGRPVASTAPTLDYALTWNGSAWAPAPVGALITWADDLAGSTTTGQWVGAISGAGGSGGAVPLNNAHIVSSLTGATSSGEYIDISAAVKGYFSGKAVYAPAVDVISAAVLAVGGTNATALNLAKTGVTTTIEGALTIASFVVAGVVHTSSAGILSSSIGTADQLYGTNHVATDTGWFTLGGDGTIVSNNLTVTAIGNVPLAYTVFHPNQTLVYNGTSWVNQALAATSITPGTSAQILMSNATPATVWATMSGDTTIGATGVTTTSSIHGATVPVAGALVTGNGPYVSGVSALTYSALNLAGGTGWVTGVLPVANLPNGAGDWTGAITSNTVAKVNGTSYGVGGALVTGNSPYVSGAGATTYSALNLAGGAGWITGSLPVGNLAQGAAAQLLVTNAGATAPAWVTLSGAVTITAAGVATVAAQTMGGDVTGTTAANTVVQVTGATGVANVLSGTNLAFLRTGHAVSTLGRLNFQGDLGSKEVIIAAKDYLGVGTDEYLSTNNGIIQYGSVVATGAVIQFGGPSGNNVSFTSSGATFNSTKLALSGTPIFADSNSDITIGASSADKGTAGQGGILDLAPVGIPATSLPSTHVGVWANASQRLVINGTGVLISPNVTALVQWGTQAPLASSVANGTNAQNTQYQGQIGGATSFAGATAGSGGSLTVTSPAGGAATGSALVGGAAGDLILNAGAGGAGATPGAAGLLRLRLQGSDQLVFEANGARLYNATANDFGGGVQVLSMGASGTTAPTALQANGIGIYTATGTKLGLNANGILFTGSSTNVSTIAISQPTQASVAGVGANGNSMSLTAQGGQPATGGTNAGGNGGNLALTAGAFGTSGGGTPGNGGNASLTGGTGNTGASAGGTATVSGGGVSGTGAAGNAILNGAFSTAGANGLAQLASALVVYLSIGAAGLDMANTTQTIAASGNTTVSAANLLFPIIRINAVTLTAPVSITLPNSRGVWFFDVTNITTINLGVTFKSGSATSSSIAAAGASGIVMVCTYGGNTIAINS